MTIHRRCERCDYRHDPDKRCPKPETAPELRENAEMHGLEIRFPTRPTADVLKRLKANGWRWSRRNGCWYRKDSQPARIFAEALVASMERSGAEQ